MANVQKKRSSLLPFGASPVPTGNITEKMEKILPIITIGAGYVWHKVAIIDKLCFLLICRWVTCKNSQLLSNTPSGVFHISAHGIFVTRWRCNHINAIKQSSSIMIFVLLCFIYSLTQLTANYAFNYSHSYYICNV